MSSREPIHAGGEPVLVTGGQGFVGAWLADRLAREGAHVVVPIRIARTESRFWREGVHERCTVVEADLTDAASTRELLGRHDFRAVYHLAGQAIVGEGTSDPLPTWRANVAGTYTLLDACRERAAAEAPLERIVVASSDHVYGQHDDLPIREDQELRARFPYEASKACAELAATSYAASFGLPLAIVRMANVYGPGDLSWSRIVPCTARSLVLGERPVVRSDGSPERDYVYIDDAIDAYLAVARSLDDRANHGRIWNAGLGVGISVLQMVKELIATARIAVEPVVMGEGPGRPDRRYIDATAIRTELGWAPQWDLETGLARTYAWYEDLLGTRAAA